MALLKALFLGGILTLIVSGAIRGANSTGGYLNIVDVQLHGHFFGWSWPLFIVGTGIAWGIMLMMK